MFMYILENIMFLSFIRFQLLSVEQGKPISHQNMVIRISVALLAKENISIHKIS